MNQNAMACPTQQQLTAFAAGKLNVTDSAEIEQHLAGCDSCCQLLKRLPDDNTLVSLLSDPQAETAAEKRTGPASDADPTAQRTAARATVPPSGEATEIADSPLAEAAAALPEALVNHGRYRILELLGRGGMGDVYKAHHRMMNRPVALKVINGQLVNSHAAVQRFHREVQAAARLAHPNIVTAYDAEQAGDAHFLVMEFVEGQDLATLVRQRGPLPVAEACEYIRQAAEGLEHAHRLGMVHRDIKPQNLMVSPLRIADSGLRIEEQGESSEKSTTDQSAIPNPQSAIVKILDFGLAGFASDAIEQVDDAAEQPRVATQLTMMGSMMGTPDYVSPEQARDAHSADIRSDIYSLGCTLYFLLTGKPPFQDDSVVDKVLAHVEREPKPLRDFRDDAPAELEHVLRRMMAKDPAERYQTPSEAAHALEQVIQQVSASAPAPLRAGFHGMAARPGPARVLVVVAISLLAFFVVAAAAIYVLTNQGRVVIQSEVDDVKIAVLSGGKQIEIIDLKTGSQVKWLPTGDYELKMVGDDNDVVIDRNQLEMTRLGTVIVTVKWKSAGRTAIASFQPPAATITRDGVSVDGDAWKITSPGDRTVRLFEVAKPRLAPGPFLFRAKLKSENVKGRAYLEMWARLPGEGEFFSKGFHNAISGSNDWAEYEIPFFLKKGQQPDLIKLNVTIEGGGTVWIKDVELYGRTLETSPPVRSGGTVAAGVNLIDDPSLEEATAALPRGWSKWLDDGPDYRCEIARVGRTGSRSLSIAGEGTRAVVFTNGVPVDRTKRYALKGWAKYEGAGGRAIIKFNYFHDNKWLGVNDLVGVTAGKDGWQQLQKTDTLDQFPEASQIWVSCNVEGGGNAWFDDLQLVAYDRDKLPADFDAVHGKNNHLSADLDFDRWIGRWETTTVYKPTAASTAERTIQGEAVVRKLLDDRLLFWQWTGKDGADQYIALLGFDAYAGGYHIWLFGSGGEVYERTGQWDAASQTLTLHVKPPSPGITGVSTDRFVKDDQIESTLLVKSADGQVTRDMRATWIRKEPGADAADPKDAGDIALANGPADSEPLRQLQPMVGDWSIRQTMKPSVWFPEGETSTGTEQVAWILGGRALLFRAYDDEKRLTTLALMTYEPAQRSYHYWHFASDVLGGQWRITWDGSSRGFHWRSIDMPTGWIGTGFNRWIDNDTFDNQALIKDEQGRVLLDVQLEKRRIKGGD